MRTAPSRGFPIEAYAETHLDVAYQTESGLSPQIVARCPTCSGEKKLWINKTSGYWTCFRCGRGGGISRLVSEVEGISLSEARKEVLRASIQPLGRPLAEIRPRRAPLEPQEPPVGGVGLPDAFEPVYEPGTRLWRYPVYLRARGVTPETARRYGLGYCRSGRYAGRVILPFHVEGRISWYQGRLVVPGLPPYLAPPGKSGPVLYGYDEAIGAREVVLCEGPFDVLVLSQYGIPALALAGKAISTGQIALLRRAHIHRVTVLLDADAAPGTPMRDRPDPDAVAEAILAVGIDARVASLPPGLDPATSTREQVLQALLHARRPTLLARAQHTRTI